MSDQERTPDHTEDPRKQEEGEGGYPETQPGGGGGDPRKREGDTDAPSQSSPDEGDPEQSTGNPGAAG